jgi:nitrous oxidase accessory protein NosD
MSKSIFFIGIIILLSCTIIASGETLTVGPNQPFTTIQSAIDSAQPYDIIQVSCGIYHESIQLLKPLSLHGETGCTIITHPDDADIITVSADNCTITGFTIQNGRNESYSGLYILSDGN